MVWRVHGAAQTDLKVIDYSQEEADELIAQGDAQQDYRDLGLG